MISLQSIFLVGVGGFLGAVCRFLAVTEIKQATATWSFPAGTFFVNMLGSLLIGFLYGIGESKQIFSNEIRLALFVGFLGSFTTYSTFAFESVSLIKEGNLGWGLLNVAGQIVVGLTLVVLGNFIARYV